MIINFNQSEKSAFVWAFDKILFGFQQWADQAGIDIDNDSDWKDLNDILSEIDDADAASIAQILAFIDVMRSWERHNIFHHWTIESQCTGELFEIIGRPGADFYTTMLEQGFDMDVWKCHLCHF